MIAANGGNKEAKSALLKLKGKVDLKLVRQQPHFRIEHAVSTVRKGSERFNLNTLSFRDHNR